MRSNTSTYYHGGMSSFFSQTCSFMQNYTNKLNHNISKLQKIQYEFTKSNLRRYSVGAKAYSVWWRIQNPVYEKHKIHLYYDAFSNCCDRIALRQNWPLIHPVFKNLKSTRKMKNNRSFIYQPFVDPEKARVSWVSG